MSCKTIWWGRTKWWWSAGLSPYWNSGWLVTRDSVSGPGKTGTFSLGTNVYVLNKVAQFWLFPHRIPSGFNLHSEPEIRVRGGVMGHTGKWILGDRPSANCDLTLKQVAYYNGSRVRSTWKKIPIISITNNANEREYERYGYHGRRFKFDDMTIRQRNQNLNIDLHVKLRIAVEGHSTINFGWGWFNPFGTTEPQWDICSGSAP